MKPNIFKLSEDLSERWIEYRYSNDWGSGEDALSATTMDKVEREFYEEWLFEQGYSDDIIDQVLDQLGYSIKKGGEK